MKYCAADWNPPRTTTLCIYTSDSRSASIGRLCSDINLCLRQSEPISGHVFPGVPVLVLTLQSLGSQNQKGWKWVIPAVWPDIFSSTFEINILLSTRQKVNRHSSGRPCEAVTLITHQKIQLLDGWTMETLVWSNILSTSREIYVKFGVRVVPLCAAIVHFGRVFP